MKRPLVWVLAFYLAGLVVYQISFSAVIGIDFFILLFSMWWMLTPKLSFENKFKNFNFLFSLPFVFLLGYLLMNHQVSSNSMDKAFTAETKVKVSGQLEAITDKGDYLVLALKNTTITMNTAQKYYNNKINIYTSFKGTFRIGNTLSAEGTIQKFKKASNPGQFNEYQYNKMLGIDYKMNADSVKITNTSYSKFLQTLYETKLKYMQIYTEILPEKNAGILAAMILGDTSQLDSEIKELYKESGISHILAISGVHISLLGITLYQLLRRTKIPLFLTAALSVFIIFSYGILTNFSVSTNRAVVMLIVLIGASLIGRTYDILSATSLSALIILIQSPLQIMNAGFLLSFGAIIGIAVIYPILSNLITLKYKIMDAFLISFSIQIITLPIILYYFYEFPTYSIFINMIILPTSSIIILLAIIAGLAGGIYLPLGRLLIGAVHYILNFYEMVCNIGKKLPGRIILVGRPEFLIILAYSAILVLFISMNRKKKVKSSMILLSFLIIILIKPTNITFEVTFLDVGQGDGIFMRAPSGTTYLIDGGSTDVSKVGQYRIEPFLKSKGVSKIDYAIMTHADADHISGLKELMEGMNQSDTRIGFIKDINKNFYNGSIQIKHLILPAISSKDDAYKELVVLAESNGIPILYIKKGDIMEDGKLKITCLHPVPNFIFTSRNAYSTVLSVNYKEFDLLLTGDLEEDGEELLVKTLENSTVNYNILKVAHHGSKYSSYEDFLNIVKPEISIISCGLDNSYGHPHSELINRLKSIKSDIEITYESGAVTVQTDGNRMEVKEYLKK
jgi:competence protein ComEC